MDDWAGFDDLGGWLECDGLEGVDDCPGLVDIPGFDDPAVEGCGDDFDDARPDGDVDEPGAEDADPLEACPLADELCVGVVGLFDPPPDVRLHAPMPTSSAAAANPTQPRRIP